MNIHMVKLQNRWYNPVHVVWISGISQLQISIVTMQGGDFFHYDTEEDRDAELEAAIAEMHNYLNAKGTAIL